MLPKMVDFWANIKWEIDVEEMQQSKSITLHKTKAPRRKKVPKQIVASFHFSTMVVSYNLHFVNYNMGKKQIFNSFLLLCGRRFT
jgi:hypothetical protein